MKRRDFIAAGTATVIGSSTLLSLGQDRAENATADISSAPTNPPKGWLWPTLKVGMIREGNGLAEKFAIARQAGFAGVELNAPGFDVDEANAAAEKTGVIIDGTVGDYHWKIRHTDPDPAVRDQALKNLREGIRKTAAVGADTMLLVPGRGDDGDPNQVLDRAVTAVRAALPQAEKHGVKILIENVWNEFLYDHDGDSNQTADRLAAFVDSFDSPLVGMQYDIGNHWKYGDPAAWIRTLDKRIMKLDIKGFSRATNQFTPITKGDIHWPSVKTALRDIGFTGWLAAEVSGGNRSELKTVRQQMETALACGETVA